MDDLKSAPVSPQRLAELVETIDVIASSNKVGQYSVGYTARSPEKRFNEYRPKNYAHFVILATGMKRPAALNLERALFEAAVSDKSSVLYEKYRDNKRDGPYRGSPGGKTVGAEEPVHSVYMVWKKSEA